MATPTRPTTAPGTTLARNGAAGTQLAAELAPRDWTRAYLDTIKAAYCRDLSDVEFALAVSASKACGLRLETREIWAYKRGPTEPVTIDISVDGARAIAFASGVFAGEEGPLFCGQDGAYTDTWLPTAMPLAAKCIVWRTDVPRPFTAVVQMQEFRALAGNSPVWAKAPIWQLGLKAVKHAYRKGWRKEMAAAEQSILSSGARLGDGGQDNPALFAEPSESEVTLPARVVDAATGEVLNAPARSEAEDVIREKVPPGDADEEVDWSAEKAAYLEAVERYQTAHDAASRLTDRISQPRQVLPEVPLATVLRWAEHLETFVAHRQTTGALSG